MTIPLFRPYIREEAIEGAGEVLRSGWLGMGRRTLAFEKAFAEYVDAPFCVGLNSCTSALHLALHVLDLPPGSEVITTALTFVATNHVILYEGCKPVFADIQPETGNLDVHSVRERISERTRSIMLVHYGGYPCDLDDFYAISRDRGIPIIEDCSHAAGATYRGKKIGGCGELQAFSFQAVKNLPIGDGGALVVRSEELDNRLRRLRWLGISSDTYQRSSGKTYRWAYEVPEVGFKYHMNDIEAAIGLVQLHYLDEDNRSRSRIADFYRRELAGVPGLRFLEHKEDRASSDHLFCVLVEKRDALIDKLQAESIQSGVHYYRNDRYPMYEEQDLPNTERFCQRALSLPMYVTLQEEQLFHIVNTIRTGW
jgi:perosamine synthetase